MTRYVSVTGGNGASGRRLAYETWGDPNGAAVFLLHGTPGSRFGPRPRELQLALMGIRLIAFDRPGYGDSDRLPRRSVADAAADVEAIADDLGVERFAVIGRSGGGPHALACAAVLSGRVTAAATLVGLAPRDAEGLDWLDGMGEGNVREYRAAMRAWLEHGDDAAMAFAEASSPTRNGLTNAVEFLRAGIEAEVPDVDRRILADPYIRRYLIENFRHAGMGASANWMDRPGKDKALAGWVDDAMAFTRPWGFDLSDIVCPVLLWHGEEDIYSPVSHSRWLAGHIKDATLVTDPASAHFGALVVLPSVLEWLVSRMAGRPAAAGATDRSHPAD